MRRTSTLALLLAATSAAHADYTTFFVIPGAVGANDMTPDGRVVVGSSNLGAYYWTAETGVVEIGGLTATGVSDDGTVISGDILNEDGYEEAAIWTQATGWTPLGQLPGGLACPSVSDSYEISADGQTIVGLGWYDGCQAAAVKWSETGGLEAMEVLANGSNRASVVAGNGTIAGGFAQGSFSRTPALWDVSTGAGTLLDPTGDVQGEVHYINADGSIVMGSWNGSAFIRTNGGPIETFNGYIPNWENIPTGRALDGTIVGFDVFGASRRAWIKFPGELPQQFSTFLTNGGAIGVPNPIQVVQAISDDGRVIIGHGFLQPAFIARIHPDADLDQDLDVDFDDLLILLSAWGPCGDPCPADLDGDGSVGFGDLLEVLSSWS